MGNSALAPAAMIANEEAAAEAIKKRLMRESNGLDKAVKFGNILTDLQRNVPFIAEVGVNWA